MSVLLTLIRWNFRVNPHLKPWNEGSKPFLEFDHSSGPPGSTGSSISGRRGYSGLPTTVQDKTNAVSTPELVCQEQIQ
jgi:hypothetical protein